MNLQVYLAEMLSSTREVGIVNCPADPPATVAAPAVWADEWYGGAPNDEVEP